MPSPDFVFDDATVPQDTSPHTPDVEYPCDSCGKEAGPYSGRGRKPKFCTNCKPKRAASGVRVTGGAGNAAAQAAKTLVQLNSIFAMGAAAMGLFKTAGSSAGYQETFEAQAYAALLTDPALCQAILRTGSKSAKVSLVMAYGGMGIA